TSLYSSWIPIPSPSVRCAFISARRLTFGSERIMSSESNPGSDRPNPEELTQVNFYFEGNERVIPPKTDGMPVETPPEWRNPTVEQLAGVTIHFEAGKPPLYSNGQQPPAPEPK